MANVVRLASYALLIGACAAACNHRERSRDALHLVRGSGAFWRVEGATGRPEDASAIDHRLWLLEDQQLTVRPTGDAELRSASFTAQRTSETAHLSFYLRDSSPRRLRVDVVIGVDAHIQSYREQDGVPDLPLQSARQSMTVADTYRPLRYRIDATSDGCAVYLNDALLLVVPEPGEAVRSIRARCRGGKFGFDDIAARDDRGRTYEDDLSRLRPASPWPSLWRAVGGLLAAYALVAAFLRSLCLGRPAATSVHRAAVTALVPPSVMLLPLYWVSSPWLIPAAGIALVPGLLAGVYRLRRHTSGDGRCAGRSRVRPLVVGVGLLALAGSTIGALRYRDVASRIDVEREASALDGLPFARRFLPAETAAFERLELGRDDALNLDGRYRDFSATAEVELAPGAALELRLRSPGGIDGLALILSSDPGLPSGFHVARLDHFQRLGTRCPTLPANQVLKLEVTARGRDLSATIDGEEVARAVASEFPRGSIRLLTAGGAATLSRLRVEPHPSSLDDVPSPTWPALRAAVVPILLVLLFAAVAAGAARIPYVRAVECAAFATLPLCAVVAWMNANRSDSPAALALGSVGVVLMLLFLPMVHGARLTTARYLLVVVVAIAAAPAAIQAAAGPQDRLDVRASTRNQRINEMSFMEWSGDRLDRDWLHVQHPLVRRFNEYLVDHRLHGEHVQREKAAANRRVIAIGSSSTYGYNLPAGRGLDWPAQLEQLLDRSADGDVEVVNAAVCGSTGIRLFYYLRNVLVEFAPDIVLLSLYYNDAVALSQGDEPAYYDRVTAEDYRRHPLSDLRQRFERRRELRALTAILSADAEDAPSLWRGISGASSTPADRFAGVLRRFAELARERGFLLVLAKEPIRNDRPRFWKEEFYAAIDEVGREYDLPVVDPRTAFAAAGDSGRLFMDEVHLKAEGCRVMAGALAEVLTPLLATPETAER